VATTPKVLTVGEVAAFVRVSHETVYRLGARGQLPGRKTGRIRQLPKDATEKYVEEESVVGHTGCAARGGDPSAVDSGDDMKRLLASAGALEP